MDKALVFGTKDCRFESCQDQMEQHGPVGKARACWQRHWAHGGVGALPRLAVLVWADGGKWIKTSNAKWG